MGELRLIERNVHEVAVDDRRMLFHVPTTSLFELDGLSGAVLDLFRSGGPVSADDVRQRFDGRFPPQDVVDAIQDLIDLDIVNDGRPLKPEQPPIKIQNFPLTTIVLNVNTGCNLSCSYCYKEDLATPADGDRMAFETAKNSIELLLAESPDRDRYNIVFFGGEPLSNMALIRNVVAYAEDLFPARGKQVDFTLTTNATLLTEELVDYFDAHRFGLTVSMDGPKALHDKNRKTVGGKGSYDVVAAKARILLDRYRSRPVGARVTLTAGVTDVVRIWDHLFNDIGFHEVGFSPVTAGDIELFNLNGPELAEVFDGMKRLGGIYLDAALENKNIGFSNMHQLMTDLHEGSSKALPCGAGVGMLAVDKDGGLNLCHRFTGSELDTFGTVRDGIDRENLSRFIEDRADRTHVDCGTCRIRNLCSGGCYHESYARYSDPMHPTYHYCDLMRDWVDFGVGIYSRIMADNPAFFETYVTPRRANGK